MGRTTRLIVRAGAAAAFPVLAGCGGGGSEPAPSVASVSLSQTAATLVPLATVTLTATPRDADGRTLTSPVSWSSSNPSVASVSAGVVTGVAAGTATITATAESRSATAGITVKDGAIVGAGGGVVTALNGAVELVIPPNALSATTVVTVEPATGFPPSPRLVGQTAIELSPDGLSFATPATLRLRYQVSNLPAGPPERLLAIHRVQAGAWQPGATSVVDQVAKTVTSSLTGFSTWGLLTPPLVDNILLSQATASLTPGGTVQLTATPRDAANVALLDRDPASWSSSNPAVAAVGPSTGLVTAVAEGSALITATIEGRTATASVTVVPAGSITITGVSPATLVPGASGTITGTNFSVDPANHTLTVAGVPATVTGSTATSVSFSLPATGFPCQLTQAVPLVLTRTGSVNATVNHPLSTATARNVGLGQALLLLGAADVACNEFPLIGGAEYVVSVINAAMPATSVAGFDLTGTGGVSAMRVTALEPPAALASPRPSSPLLDEWRGFEAAHHRHLENDLALFRTMGRPGDAPAPRLRSGPDRVSRTVSQTIGTINPLNVRNIEGSSSCANVFSINARTAYVGTRVIIVEDITAPLAGTMDGTYAVLGAMYDNVMHGVLTANFGNPLAMDAQLDNDGKLVMVFTPVVNATSAFGFVTSCDFFPASQSPGTNFGEYFYARVPTTNNGNTTATSDLEAWTRFVASTIVHEVKHITSFAERISRAGGGQVTLEESWLEEGSARLAEELWFRARTSQAARGNINYQAGLYCDWRFTPPVPPACANWYVAMFKVFDNLYDYYVAQQTRSLFGSAATGDVTFYGSVWSFLRWMIDTYAASEGAFVQALVQSHTVSGVNNLQARTGKSIGELMARWSLAMFLDDRSGVTVSDPTLAFASWNLTNVYLGLNTDFPQAGLFPLPSPISWLEQPFGTFVVRRTLNGGTTMQIWLRGAQATPQLLQLTGQFGAALPGGIRLAIARVK